LATVGVNATVIVQLAPGPGAAANDPVQVLLAIENGALGPAVVNVTAALLALEMVRGCEVVVPTTPLRKICDGMRRSGEPFATAMVLPLRLIVCGLRGALSVSVTVACRSPFCVGVNVTDRTQDVFVGSEAGQLRFWRT
jgi:hypothetical protein